MKSFLIFRLAINFECMVRVVGYLDGAHNGRSKFIMRQSVFNVTVHKIIIGFTI